MVRCLVKFSFSFFREEMVEGILKRVSQIFLPSLFPRFSLFLYFQGRTVEDHGNKRELSGLLFAINIIFRSDFSIELYGIHSSMTLQHLLLEWSVHYPP